MRKEFDEDYQLFIMLLFNPIYRWELEKPEVLTEI